MSEISYTPNVPGYDAAPPCAVDIDRNHSVYNAILALDRAEAATSRSVMQNEMQTAAVNLEQVMNYGALQWGDLCMTCNPYFSIDANPDHSYIGVAWRLINLSRWYHNDPNYNGYLGLVETIENNFQRMPYCGDKATTMDVTTIIDDYVFGRVTPNDAVLCSPGFALTDQPRPIGWFLKSCNSNESYYWFFKGEVIFLDASGYVTSILRSGGGTSYWEGPYKGDISLGITHYINRDDEQDPCANPSWKGKQPPPLDAKLGEPPYGESIWAQDGNKFWGIGTSNSDQYFILTGNNSIIRYTRCGDLIMTHIVEKSETNMDGQQQWSGYTLDAQGNNTGKRWYLIWL